MTSEIFGLFGVKLRIECFKSCIAPELSDFTLIDKLIIIVIELYAVLFELFHILKADTVILLTAWDADRSETYPVPFPHHHRCGSGDVP